MFSLLLKDLISDFYLLLQPWRNFQGHSGERVMLSSEITVLVLFVEYSIIVRFVLHLGIDQMKAI